MSRFLVSTPRCCPQVEELESRNLLATAARPLNAVFADNLYDALLQRVSDSSGLASWTTQLNQGTSPDAVALDFTNTREYQKLEIGSLYNWYLNRSVDTAASPFWTAQLNGGATIEQVKANILGSTEFFQNAGGGTNSGFLNALYQDVLNRPIESAGSTAFLQQLANGTSRTAVAFSVVTSNEGLQDVVSGLFLEYLHRPADSAGEAFWVNAIQHGSMTDQQVSAGILSSAESLNLLSQPTQPNNNVIVQWNQIFDANAISASLPPPDTTRGMAMMDIAMYDAIAAIDPSYQNFNPNNEIANLPSSALPGTSRQAAAAEAAYTVLVSLFPAQQPLLQVQLSTTLATLPPGVSQTEGVTLGQQVGNAIIAWRSNDGANNPNNITYTPGSTPTSWQPTPGPAAGNNYQPALEPWWGTVTPFAMSSDTEFLAPAPPLPGTAAYTAGVAETQSLGAANSTTRTPDQTQIAFFWNDATTGKNATPPGHWLEIADQQTLLAGTTLDASARLMAQFGIGQADAAITIWQSKYQYNYIRPVTLLNNLGTTQPAYSTLTWQPLLGGTPNFPSYVSGHSGFSAAAATVLDNFFGNNVSFSATSDGLPGVVRSYASFDAAASEAVLSRIYGGIHWTWDVTAGTTLGTQVGTLVIQNFLLPAGS